jgi:hypothetical protein
MGMFAAFFIVCRPSRACRYDDTASKTISTTHLLQLVQDIDGTVRVVPRGVPLWRAGGSVT